MVTVNHNVNIQRIIDVIKDDSTVFDDGETEGLLREVNFGDPDSNDKKTIKQKPAVYVTTRNNIQSTSYPSGISNNGNVNTLTVQYDVVLLAISKEKTQKSQVQLYTLMTNLRTIFENNPTFTDPVTSVDPIFSRSIVNETSWDTKLKGQLITSVTFTISATIGQSLIITIPGIGDLDILSDTGDDGRNNREISNDEGNTKRTKGEFVGVRFFEYEYDTGTFNDLEDLIEADNTLDLTLQYPSGDITYTAKLEYQRQSERFDGVRTVFLQVNRETV